MRIVKRRRATEDLVSIWEYSFDAWGAAQADLTLAQIEGVVSRLREMPLSGPACDDIERGLRRIVAGHHLIFYVVHEGWIEIVRVLHQRMDVLRQLDD